MDVALNAALLKLTKQTNEQKTDVMAGKLRDETLSAISRRRRLKLCRFTAGLGAAIRLTARHTHTQSCAYT